MRIFIFCRRDLAGYKYAAARGVLFFLSINSNVADFISAEILSRGFTAIFHAEKSLESHDIDRVTLETFAFAFLSLQQDRRN